jgi:Fur family ferric uptake transcriptional regulator
VSQRSPKEAIPVPPAIQARLEQAGLRRTLATRAVLGLFLSNPQGSLTHSQALASLTARGLDINRVTLYRLLDRLAACGVLQRHADDDARTWRFGLADAPQDGVVPRFECDACHRQFRLTEASAPTRAVAGDLFRTLARLGHQGQRVDLSVHGTCAGCVPPAADGPGQEPAA